MRRLGGLGSSAIAAGILVGATGFFLGVRRSEGLAGDLGVTGEHNGLATDYHALVDSVSDGIWFLDADARTTFVSDRISRLIGYPVAEIMDRAIYDFMDGEGLDAARTSFARRDVARTAPLTEYRLRRKDGSSVWISMNVVPLHAADGTVRGWLATIVDRTSERHTDLALAEAENRYRLLADGMPHLVWTEAADGSVNHCNEQWFDYTGLTAEQTKARDWGELVHPDDVKRSEEQWLESIRNGKPYEFEARLRRAADGMYRWHIIRAIPAFDESGAITTWIGSCADINDFKVATETRSILDTIGHIIAIRGENGLEYLSPTWSEYTGTSTDGDASSTWYEAIHPEDIGLLKSADGASEAAGRHIRQNEIRLRAADGQYRWFLSRTVGLPGTPKRWLNTLTDINDFKRAQAAVGRSETRYRALTDAMPQMVWINDANHRLEYVNERWGAYTGIAFEPGLFYEAHVLFHPDDFDQVRAGRAAMIAQVEFEAEIRMRRHDGKYRWHLLRMVPLIDSIGAAERWIVTATDIEARKVAEAQLAHRAEHDPLTDLPNRFVLMDRLSQAITVAEQSASELLVAYMDIDHFKGVNDTLGHRAGDRLLVEVSARIRSILRADDIASRFGGDEFVLVCATGNSELDAPTIAARIALAVSEPFILDGKEIAVASSIGISRFPSDGFDAADLVQKADAAMYAAKKSGRNTYALYGSQAQLPAVPALELEVELRAAIAREQFVVFYQPIIDLNSGRPVGAEALVRWMHPERGILLPGEFIPFAEEYGLIAQIGELVLGAACAQIQRLNLAVDDDFTIAVNVSARQFQKPGFVESIASAIASHGLLAHHLEIEITESIVMYDTAAVITTLRELEALGVRLSIDDFGTGYSSLAYIKNFPLHTLKIDRSFVIDIAENLTDQAIAKTLVTLAHSLRMRVIAEGVETIDQLEQLRSFGADCFQGYLVSRPLPVADFERFLHRYSLGAARSA